MKNNLSSEEWLVLADYLDQGERMFDFWRKSKSLSKNQKILRSAQKKFFETAREIRMSAGKEDQK